MILTYARNQALVLPSALASSGRSAASKAWIRRDLTFYPTTTIPCWAAKPNYWSLPSAFLLGACNNAACKFRTLSLYNAFNSFQVSVVNMGHRAEGFSGICKNFMHLSLPYFVLSEGMQPGSKSNCRRKFRSQTSDNMDRWKAEVEQKNREEKRREKIREEKVSERRSRCAKR